MNAARETRPTIGERILRAVMPTEKAAALIGDIDEDLQQSGRARFALLRRARYIAGYFLAACRLRLGRAAHRTGDDFMPSPPPMLSRLASSLRLSVRDAFRTFRRFPGSTAVAFVILMLGIAAATVTFSVVDTVVLRPLAYPDDSRLVAIYGNTLRDGDVQIVSPADYFAWRENTTSFESLAAWMFGAVEVQPGDRKETVWEVRTTADLFSALHVPMLLGQPFASDDEVNGRDNVAVISYGLWQRAFGGDPLVVGQSLPTATGPIRVVAVAPRTFSFPPGSSAPVDLWLPYVSTPTDRSLDLAHGRSSFLQVIGRLRDGVSVAQARAEVERATASIAAAHPEMYDGWNVRLSTLRQSLVQRVRGWMMLSLWAVCLVMLVACVNVANLLLARTTARTRDLAVRAAMGATRAQIMLSLIVESLLLSCLAAAGGLVLARSGLALVKATLPVGIARATGIALDGRVLVATVAAAIVTGVAFGLVPAWSASRTQPVDVLKDGGTITAGPARRRWRSAFLVAQAAFVVVLLTAMTLLVGSFAKVVRTDLGFKAENLLGFRMSPPLPGHTAKERSAQARQFYAQALDAVRPLPGVAEVALMAGGEVPLFGGSTVSAFTAPQAPDRTIRTELRRVSAGYFDAAGIRLLAGRAITDADREDSEPVVVLDELAAARAFGGLAPVGSTVHFPYGDLKVVGVVANVKLMGAEGQPVAAAYRPLAQDFQPPRLVVRTSVASATVAPSIVRALQTLLPRGATVQTFDVQDRLWRLTADRRFSASMMVLLALLALVIAAVGTYGVTSSVVAQQTRAIGVHIALGATAGRIIRRVVADTGRLLIAGAALGLVGSAVIARMFASLLFGVRATDLIVYVVPVALLAVAGLAAAFLPARRASRVDVLVILRQE